MRNPGLMDKLYIFYWITSTLWPTASTQCHSLSCEWATLDISGQSNPQELQTPRPQSTQGGAEEPPGWAKSIHRNVRNNKACSYFKTLCLEFLLISNRSTQSFSSLLLWWSNSFKDQHWPQSQSSVTFPLLFPSWQLQGNKVLMKFFL